MSTPIAGFGIATPLAYWPGRQACLIWGGARVMTPRQEVFVVAQTRLNDQQMAFFETFGFLAVPVALRRLHR